MSSNDEKLKQHHLHALAQDYERSGYRVVLQPDRTLRPPFLANFAPGLLAFKDEENVVGDVWLREELVGNSAFLQLVEAVDANPGWRLDISVINPDELPIVGPLAQEMTTAEIRERIATTRYLLASGQKDVALLIAWSALETSLRQFAKEYDTEIDRPQTAALIKRLVWLGLLNQSDYERLQRALRYRNLTAHGFHTEDISEELVEEIIAQVEGLQYPGPHPAIA